MECVVQHVVSQVHLYSAVCLTVILQGELREIIKWHQLPSVLPVLSRQHDSVRLEVTGVFTGVISNMEHWRDLRSAQ